MKYSKPTENNGRLESVEIYEGEALKQNAQECWKAVNQSQTPHQ